MTRARREHPAPLPGTVKVRLVGSEDDVHRVLDVLTAAYTCTDPASYSGDRWYLDVDTRPRVGKVTHGTRIGGGRFPDCICPAQACGGVTADDMSHDCPEHGRAPALSWHWEINCPAR